MSYRVLTGDCIEQMRTLPDKCVNTCVTSPPYWRLRDYGNDGQIGLEETPTAYVNKMVDVFREVHRVLRDDGTLWLNIGDSYAADRGGTCMPAETLAGGESGEGDATEYSDPRRGRVRHKQRQAHPDAPAFGLKHKDLVGIPWRLAFALQADGWYLRQDIIWHKPNPMPESVQDRCTKAHEYVFMLTKSARYYYDIEAVKEPAIYGNGEPDDYGSTLGGAKNHRSEPSFNVNPPEKERRSDKQRGHSRRHAGFNDRWDAMEKAEQCSGMRNKRSVWTVATRPYKGAHFATFPPALIEPCILAGCPVGGTVLDPFGGSGTTAQVAAEHGREAILCELNPDYVKLIHRRMSTVQLRLVSQHDSTDDLD